MITAAAMIDQGQIKSSLIVSGENSAPLFLKQSASSTLTTNLIEKILKNILLI